MKYIADLHVHSKYSMATAKNLDLEHMYIAAQLKGITVVATGDVTHPAWVGEIKEKLIPAEKGFFKLKQDIADLCDMHVPLSCRGTVRFILTSEISSIYKKNDRTRKNHNLVFLPDLAAVDMFNATLDNIGNIKSDGRPILGIDSRNLLEILLESSEDAFMIPAHIWTPWFSMLGSKSGFDSIEACFDDLSAHIFAVETGLSSDPAMNWQVKNLDHVTLVSNSDAHSPMKLGREANIFDTELNYFALKSALKTGDTKKFLGTFEFFPEEGKYHMDGHRKCGVCFNPEQSITSQCMCPVCDKPLTLGVMHRVSALADRKKGEKPPRSHPFYSMVPLVEIISEIVRVGPNSKKVVQIYNQMLSELGSEFSILHELSIDQLNTFNLPLLGEALCRVRSSRIHLIPGFDGEFGKVKIFNDQERNDLLGQKTMFNLPAHQAKDKTCPLKANKSDSTVKNYHRKQDENKLINTMSTKQVPDKKEMLTLLNQEQKDAVQHEDAPLLIVAGPGTGKTRTLTHKIAYLSINKKIRPEHMLAVTFTVKAAQEMEERLLSLLGNTASLPLCTTFHSLCFRMLNTQKKGKDLLVIDDMDKKYFVHAAMKQADSTDINKTMTPKELMAAVALVKQRFLTPFDKEHIKDIVSQKQISYFLPIYEAYQQLLTIQNLLDHDDLIADVVRLFDTDKAFLKRYRETYTHVFVDEYQDLNDGQYRIIRALCPTGKNLCVIGDPDQSIYGFRGSNVAYFNRFSEDYPNAAVIRLGKNYRSTQTILDASFQVLKKEKKDNGDARLYSDITGHQSIGIMETATEKAEAVAVGKQIEQLVGGTGFHSIDFDKIDEHAPGHHADLSFADIAVLYRTHGQADMIADVLHAAGIPCRISSKKKIFANKKIIDLMSLFSIVETAGTYGAFERIVNGCFSGIGQKTLDLFLTWGYTNAFTLNEALFHAQRFPIKGMSRVQQLKIDDIAKKLLLIKDNTTAMTVENKLQYIMDHSDSAVFTETDSQTKDALRLIKNYARPFFHNSRKFLTKMALTSDADMYDHKSEKVALMTLHASKGLEFPVVFITGCEEGLIPYRRFKENPATSDLEEEKRLFYVGMTRAKQRLFLSFAAKRRIFGKQTRQIMSPFVLDIENSLKTFQKQGKSFKRHYVQKQLFA
jgi:DNA helicase-2/ATP-dependent DNA helicase PcrA